MQEDNATIAKTVSKILWKSINEVKDDLIGIPIRKRFGSGVWHDGVITAVTTKSASADNRNGSSISRCTIQYDPTAPTLPGIKAVDIPNQETLAVDETLELWIIAYDMMYGVPPTLKVKRPPTLFQRKQHKQASGDPYALTQFKGLLSYTERAHGGVTIEDLEASKLVLNRNPHSKATHVYGRMLPNAIHKIIHEYMDLKPTDSVVDIGHGIGNSCLQAAYTVGCKARGIECDKSRNAVAQILSTRLSDAARIHQKRDGMTFTPGSITYHHGDLQDYRQRDFLTKDITHIFFDNWNGVFSGERGGSSVNLERYVAAWFAAAPEGTIMCTVSPLRAALGCLPLSQANEVRKKLKLPMDLQGNTSSFYDMQEFELGTLGQVYSFSEGGDNQAVIRCYRYVRTRQQFKTKTIATTSAAHATTPIFLCNNRQCDWAKEGIPIKAIILEDASHGEKAAVIGACQCGVSDRVLRGKRKR